MERVHPAFEPVGGIAGKPVPAALAPHRGGIEVGHFQEDVGGGLVHFRILAPHHPGQDHGPFRVGDEHVFGRDLAFHAVQGGQGLSACRRCPIGPTLADDHLASPDLVEIEGVGRLTQLEQDEVGEIDHVVDAALADGLEGLDQPIRAGADLDALDDAPHVLGATRRVLEFDAYQPLDVGAGLLEFDGWVTQGFPQLGRDLARHADMVQGVRPVGGDVEFIHHVAQARDAVHGQPRGHGRIQDQDAVMAFAQAHFVLGADHAVGFLAAQLGLLDLERRLTVFSGQFGPDLGEQHLLALGHVGRAADHGIGLRPVRHLAYAQLVRFRMAGAFQHFRRHHAGHAAHDAHAFHFQAQGSQGPGQCLGIPAFGSGEVDVFANPIEGDFHEILCGWAPRTA